MADYEKLDAEKVTKAIRKAGGVIANAATLLGVSRQTVYSYIKKYRLQDVVEEQRATIHDIAEGNIYQKVLEGDWDASRFVVTSMPVKDKARWSNRQEITGANGAPLFSQAVYEAMERLGIEPSEVVKEFEAMILSQVEQDVSADD